MDDHLEFCREYLTLALTRGFDYNCTGTLEDGVQTEVADDGRYNFNSMECANEDYLVG